MIAEVQQTPEGVVVRFERLWKHSVQKVWSYLTDNDKLKLWFPELEVMELDTGGVIRFDMQDGTFEEMNITEVQANSVLEFTWGEDLVRFELYPETEGCRLLLLESIGRVTSHTPKDVAGWHICLHVIEELLDGRAVEPRTEEWQRWYEKYKLLFQRYMSTNENEL